MKKIIFLAVFLFLFPTALALIPENIQSICEGLNVEQCVEKSQWSDHDDCLSQIRCNPMLDDNLEFESCQTILRNVLDDCENNPTTSCYNGIAYDTSYSETCDEGVRFRTIDACGNKLDWGSCIDLDSCDTVIKTPFTGSEIPVHENCAFTDGTPVQERERTPVKQEKVEEEQEEEPEEESDTEESDDKRASEETPVPTLYQEVSEPQIEQEETEVESVQEQKQVEKTTPVEPKTTTTIKQESKKPNKVFIALIGMVFLLLLTIIVTVALWRKR